MGKELKKRSAHDPKHASASVKHAGGSVLVLAYIAASGTNSIIFIDDTETFCLTVYREMHHAPRPSPKYTAPLSHIQLLIPDPNVFSVLQKQTNMPCRSNTFRGEYTWSGTTSENP